MSGMLLMLIQVTLGQLAKEVEEEEAQQSGGAVDFSGKDKSSLEKVPGYELRPGAPKMQLRPEEEQLLPLVRHATSRVDRKTLTCLTTSCCSTLLPLLAAPAGPGQPNVGFLVLSFVLSVWSCVATENLHVTAPT